MKTSTGTSDYKAALSLPPTSINSTKLTFNLFFCPFYQKQMTLFCVSKKLWRIFQPLFSLPTQTQFIQHLQIHAHIRFAINLQVSSKTSIISNIWKRKRWQNKQLNFRWTRTNQCKRHHCTSQVMKPLLHNTDCLTYICYKMMMFNFKHWITLWYTETIQQT